MRRLALGAAVVAGSATSAFAGLDVTFDPTAAGLASGITPFQSNIQNGGDNSLAVIQSNGAFNETGVLALSAFAQGGSNILPSVSGLENSYQLFVVYTATGVLNGFNPANPTNVSGTFSSLSYSIIGIPGTSSTVSPALTTPSPGGTAPVLNATGPEITLATGGSIITSAVSLNALGVPAANVSLTLTQSGADFFAAPPGIDEYIAAFTNNTSTYSIAVNGDGSADLAIEGSFDETFNVVPEPASLTVLGTGMLALAASVRRRRRKV